MDTLLRCKRLQSCVKSVDSLIPLSTKSAGHVKRFDRVNALLDLRNARMHPVRSFVDSAANLNCKGY